MVGVFPLLILGRQWVDDLKAVPSTRHQCLKFPFKGKVINVKGDLLSEEL